MRFYCFSINEAQGMNSYSQCNNKITSVTNWKTRRVGSVLIMKTIFRCSIKETTTLLSPHHCNNHSNDLFQLPIWNLHRDFYLS